MATCTVLPVGVLCHAENGPSDDPKIGVQQTVVVEPLDGNGIGKVKVVKLFAGAQLINPF